MLTQRWFPDSCASPISDQGPFLETIRFLHFLQYTPYLSTYRLLAFEPNMSGAQQTPGAETLNPMVRQTAANSCTLQMRTQLKHRSGPADAASAPA